MIARPARVAMTSDYFMNCRPTMSMSRCAYESTVSADSLVRSASALRAAEEQETEAEEKAAVKKEEMKWRSRV